MMEAMRDQFRTQLADVGFIDPPLGTEASDDRQSKQGRQGRQGIMQGTPGGQQGKWQGGNDANAFGGDLELVRCVICAGLYPRIAQVSL